MWMEIFNEKDLKEFMDKVGFFHDSCIKEIKYSSGAYVNENLSMHAVNDQRILSVIIQRQYKNNSMFEMEFRGLKYLKLFPSDDQYTCEILDSTMIIKEDCIYWCDCGEVSEADIDNYEGTLICASALRWRPIEKCLGPRKFFLPIK